VLKVVTRTIISSTNIIEFISSIELAEKPGKKNGDNPNKLMLTSSNTDRVLFGVLGFKILTLGVISLLV